MLKGKQEPLNQVRRQKTIKHTTHPLQTSFYVQLTFISNKIISLLLS